MVSAYSLLRLVLFAGGLTLWSGGTALARPIDCSLDRREAERAICGNSMLISMDAAYSTTARRALELGVDPLVLRQRLDVLTNDRGFCAANLSCLIDVYKAEFLQLVRLILTAQGRPSVDRFLIVDTRDASVRSIPLRRKAAASAPQETSLNIGTPLLLLDDSHPVWWQVESLVTGRTGWVRRMDRGVMQLTFVPIPAGEVPAPQAAPQSAAPICPPDPALAATQAEVEQLRARLAAPPDESAACLPLRDQLAAANQALADAAAAREAAEASVASAYVPRAEYEAQAAQLAAANQALADAAAAREAAEASVASAYVPRAEYEAQAAQLTAANQALADAEAKRAAEFVERATHEATLAEVAALNAALSDMKTRMETEYVPVAEHRDAVAEILRLSEKNEALAADLRDNHVPRADHDRMVADLTSQIAALNQSLTDQRIKAEDAREAQVSALNDTLVDMRTRVDSLKRRLSEVQAALTSFIDECTATPDCARAMDLQP